MLIKAALVNALLDKTRSTEPFALLAYNVWFAEHTATPKPKRPIRKSETLQKNAEKNGLGFGGLFCAVYAAIFFCTLTERTSLDGSYHT